MSNAPPVIDTIPVWAADGSIVYVSTDETLPDDIRNQIRIRGEVMETWREVGQRCAEWAIEYPREALSAGEFVFRVASFAGVIGLCVFFANTAAKPKKLRTETR